MDTAGNLYGTTAYGGPFSSRVGQGGIVFEVTPLTTSVGNWTESTLWNFGNGTEGT